MSRPRRPAGDGHCRALMLRLSRYLDRDLGDVPCRRLEQHLRDCDACTGALKALRATVGRCHRARRAPLPAAVKRRARARIRALLRDA
jgi:anti-sigma factor RsiW